MKLTGINIGESFGFLINFEGFNLTPEWAVSLFLRTTPTGNRLYADESGARELKIERRGNGIYFQVSPENSLRLSEGQLVMSLTAHNAATGIKKIGAYILGYMIPVDMPSNPIIYDVKANLNEIPLTIYFADRIGLDGKSAYEIAVENGFEGTEQEWLESLQGEDGSPGTPGEPGKPGKTAYQSAQDGGFTGTEEEFNATLASIGNINEVLDSINGELI